MRFVQRLVIATLLASIGSAQTVAAKEPRLTVERSLLADAVTCHGDVGRAHPRPIVFAPGTGSDGSQVYALGRGAFAAMGRTLCTVSFPHRTTADLQVSVQYLVHAIRSVSRRAGRPVAVAGVSQGGLLARVALTYWPSLRSRVNDVVTAAAPHHGVLASPDGAVRCPQEGCPPALWQQAARSSFMRALGSRRDETPGRVAYTTVRSATDEVVQPHATSALRGAANILIQDVCPGRATSHIGTAVDSVTIAALADAVANRGPADPSRLPVDVCEHPYGTGLDEARTSAFVALAPHILAQGAATVPRVLREPRVRRWVRRR